MGFLTVFRSVLLSLYLGVHGLSVQQSVCLVLFRLFFDCRNL